MQTDFEIGFEEKEIIKSQTKSTLIISYGLLFSVFVYAAIAYFFKTDLNMDQKLLESLYKIFNIIAIGFIIAILGLKRTLYFSHRIIKQNEDLSGILQKWKTLDIVLLSIGESISIFGLLITLLGVPFNRTFHFFAVSGLVIIIVMPLSWSVEGKLRTLRNYYQKF